MTFIYYSLLIFLLFIFSIEVKNKFKPKSPLILKHLQWEIKDSNNIIELAGLVQIDNPHSTMEVMIPEITFKPIVLGLTSTDYSIHTRILANHPDEVPREDDYWSAYILKSKKSTQIKVNIVLQGDGIKNIQSIKKTYWIDVNWINYGPFGRLQRREGIVIPDPIIDKSSVEKDFIMQSGYKFLPIETHLLGVLDEPISILRKYTSNILKQGDIITIGETPLAVMQGRYIHPSNIDPDWTTKILCLAFHPTSSLATACGLQSLIDQVGPSRVIISWIIGILSKLIGIKGMFYRLSGKQARLIDDITGTTPPYDQTIVLGPKRSELFCRNASEELGVDVAVVDVNDLGRVKILSSSKNCNKKLLLKALRANPAGNGNEQTPIVLVRPCS